VKKKKMEHVGKLTALADLETVMQPTRLMAKPCPKWDYSKNMLVKSLSVRLNKRLFITT